MQKLTRHHRLPVSRGGTDDKRNISMVPDDEHQAFHCIFGNKTADEIAEHFNSSGVMCFNQYTEKQLSAFNILWGGMGIKEIVKDLNERWIDPNFTIRIVRKPFITLTL